MYMQTLRSYSVFMVFLSIALTVVGLTQVFPYSVDVAGIRAYPKSPAALKVIHAHAK